MSWSSEPGDESVGTPLSANDFVSALQPEPDPEEPGSSKTRLERAATETISDLRPLQPPPEMFRPKLKPKQESTARPAPTSAAATERVIRPGRPTAPPARKKSYRWMPVLVAVIIGGFIGLGGAMVADRIMNSPDEVDEAISDAGDTARADQSSQLSADADAEVGDPGGGPLGPDSETAGPEVLPINSIRFTSGTTELTNDSVAKIKSLARALVDSPNTTVEVTVRTSSEATDAQNLALSEAQATTLFDYFIASQVNPAQVRISSIGRELITIRQPVPNFVELSAGLERSPLRSAIETIPTYAIGIDPDSGELRPESVEPLQQLAEAMLADAQGRSVTLASYAFTGVDTATNDRLAAQAAAVIEDYLIATYGLDGQRIDLIVAGDAPYSVPAEIGNHISLRRIS